MKRILFLAVLLAGCGGPPSPPVPDPFKAKTALTAALDDWKAGDAAPSFGGKAVDFGDGRFKKGFKLVSYEIGQEQLFGYDVMFSVKLNITDKDGDSREDSTNFLVRTDPHAIIAKAEDD